MTDEEIGQEVHQCATELCRALNKAGEAGLSIDVVFAPTIREDLSGIQKLKGWRSGTTLKRVHFV